MSYYPIMGPTIIRDIVIRLLPEARITNNESSPLRRAGVGSLPRKFRHQIDTVFAGTPAENTRYSVVSQRWGCNEGQPHHPRSTEPSCPGCQINSFCGGAILALIPSIKILYRGDRRAGRTNRAPDRRSIHDRGRYLGS